MVDPRPVYRYPHDGRFDVLLGKKLSPLGAIIEVEPGTYTDRRLVKTDGWVTIKWLDPTAPRPKFLGSFSLSSDNWLGTLEIIGLELTPPPSAPGSNGIVFNKGRRLIVEYCYIHHFSNGVMSSHVPPGTQTSVVLRGNEISHCGQGDNLHHNVYISRVGELLAEDNLLHSSRGGHCLKHIARRATVRRNRFATTLDGVTAGTQLLDGIACGTSVIVRNTFERTAALGNKYLSTWRRRKTINGSDTPFGPYLLNAKGWPYDAAGSQVNNTLTGTALRDPRFWDPAFWAQVAMASTDMELSVDPTNPWLFQHYFADNLLIDRDMPSAPDGIGVWCEGTAPVENTGSGDKSVDLMDPPDGWVERAVVWAGRNRFEGPFGTQYDSTFAPVVDLGDTPPAWFTAIVDAP